MERIKNILLVAAVVALVAPAMASVGYGTIWGGAVSSDWANPANWTSTLQNEWYTTDSRVQYSASNTPVISDGVDMVHGSMRLWNNGVDALNVVNQTGGNVRVFPASDVWKGLYMFNRSTGPTAKNQLNISGGTFRVDDGIGLDHNGYENAHPAMPWTGTNEINVSGNGTLQLFLSGMDKPNGYVLFIGDNSVITLAGDGKFVVDPFFQTQVDAHITANRIVGIGDDLTASFDNDGNYVVSLIPEPATMVLLGLGALVLRRKR